MALLGFIYWSSAEVAPRNLCCVAWYRDVLPRGLSELLCGFSGRARVCTKGWKGLREPRAWFRQYGPAIFLMIAATLGALGFFCIANCAGVAGTFNAYASGRL